MDSRRDKEKRLETAQEMSKEFFSELPNLSYEYE